MSILALPDQRTTFGSSLGRIIERLGLPTFDDALLKLAIEIADCDHVTAFANRTGEVPRLISAADSHNADRARNTALKYISRFWSQDVAARGMPSQAVGLFGVRVAARDIEDRDYRRDCYSSLGLIERFSMLEQRGEETIRINFYRTERKGRFEDSDFDRLVGLARPLLSALRKHDVSRIPDEPRASLRLFQRRVRMLAPDMPERECEVCARIATGMSSEGIALDLGISLNTVLTYRKRAYARLRISSQNQLLRNLAGGMPTA